jgi:cephalosporin-C deacetylase-like acetyl esterase
MSLPSIRNFATLACLIAVATSTISCAANAQGTRVPPPIRVGVDHDNAIYKQGETVTFTVRLTPDSTLPKDAELTWKISKDGVAPEHDGKVQLVDGVGSFTGKLDEPGHLLCRVNGRLDGRAFEALAGAAVDPLKIKPSMPVPGDFDEFWAGQKKQLAAVPMNAPTGPGRKPAAPNVESFDVRLDCVGKAPVSGYYVRPKGAKPKSLPIILTLHGAGVRSADLAGATGWCKTGMLAMDINAHGIENGQPEKYYTDLLRGELKNYRQEGRDSRETSYFVGMFLRAVRAVDFLASQPEWDGKTIIAYGSSQGGFQAFAVAALDERISFFNAGVPAGCDHTGVVVQRVNGWPKIVPQGLDGKPNDAVLQASRYIDNVNFAARTKAKRAYVTVGFVDLTCPATTVYAAYNALPIPKEIYNDIPSGHTNSPAASEARKQSVFRYLKSLK